MYCVFLFILYTGAFLTGRKVRLLPQISSLYIYSFCAALVHRESSLLHTDLHYSFIIMPTTFKFPNRIHILDLKREKRRDYLTQLKDIYNDLNAKGYSIPSAVIEDIDSDDASFLKLTIENGERLCDIQRELSMEEGKTVAKLLGNVISSIEKNEGLRIYNVVSSSVVYCKKDNKVWIVDLTQNSKLRGEYRSAKKLNPEYVEEMKQIRQQQQQERGDSDPDSDSPTDENKGRQYYMKKMMEVRKKMKEATSEAEREKYNSEMKELHGKMIKTRYSPANLF